MALAPSARPISRSRAGGNQFTSRSRAGGNPVHKSFPRRRESSAQVVPAQAGIQWSARDNWVPAYAGMTNKWEA
ncbi:MAG: hypothetical protein K9M08_17205, partial [Pirellula sp.]|nr:hypothetical protein [Pirellula sp.]